jgi:hypothetical protein
MQNRENTKDAVPLIYGKIATIMKETKAIAKGQKNQQQGFMFRGIDSVMNELHSLFANNGVFILPETLEYSVSEKTTAKGSILYFTRAKIKFHFVAEDASEVIAINVGEAMDSADKGMNKAMSIALKYALMQMLLIPTKEEKDPDAVMPPETRPKTIAEIRQSLDAVNDALLVQALDAMLAANDKDSLVTVWNTFSGQMKSNPIFTQCMSTRKKEIGL